MSNQGSLESYRDKRNFRKTSEPEGAARKRGEQPAFVIQKHDSSNLHYDFRLEVDGVLKSWAVPRGPSTDPRDKRLAMPTEDHPLEYAGFEGTIPEGEYGAGAVIVWDRGTFRNTTDGDGKQVSLARALDQGHATFWLEGEKLQGGYALQRIGRGKSVRWLLIKMDDAGADARRDPVSTQPQSVVSGRRLEEVGER